MECGGFLFPLWIRYESEVRLTEPLTVQMEPDNIDWDNIDSTFAQDEAYENFDAPMWVDLSAFDDSLVDDEVWFCTRDCKHLKTAEDFLKRSSKAKHFRFASISEILPFRHRHRRGNSSTVETTKAEYSGRSSRPSCSGNFYEDSENRNPNFTAPLPNGSRTNKLKRPLIKTNSANQKPKQLNTGPVESPLKSHRKSQLKSTFSAQNLIGGREILSQISGFYSELKRLARGGKGASDKGGSSSGVSVEVKESGVQRERVPLVVKDSRERVQHS
ncbi:unnamed protein product [Sphenostylis stenocarpa]|uniref:Uncharacterized protein n=1 Tax=Sphenostylis stenocarpa TaxID=92480 RepID=A0AA86RY89_9FABA|nr:unnamed protein product [Sphenostylis stenocarpa]